MKRNYPLFSLRSLVYGGICALCCFVSRTAFGSPLNMIHLTQSIGVLPPLWLFNVLSIVGCFLMGISFGWIVDEIVRGFNSGLKEICAYRGALFLSFSFFLFLLWFPLLFCAERLFLSFIASVIALISLLICAIEWRKLTPIHASAVLFIDTVWMFYIMFVSLSILLNC